MNEMYVISVLMLYTLIILSNTLLNIYNKLMATTEMVEEKEFIYPKSSICHRVHLFSFPNDPKN